MFDSPRSHIRWCFNNDQIELEDPNEVLADDYIRKAQEALEVAALLEDNQYYDWTITVSYFARYFALTALLRRCGVVCNNHACDISIFQEVFVEEGEFDEEFLDSIRKGKSNRIEKQYGITRTDESAAKEQRESAVEFVTELSAYLEGLAADRAEKIRNTLEELSS